MDSWAEQESNRLDAQVINTRRMKMLGKRITKLVSLVGLIGLLAGFVLGVILPLGQRVGGIEERVGKIESLIKQTKLDKEYESFIAGGGFITSHDNPIDLELLKSKIEILLDTLGYQYKEESISYKPAGLIKRNANSATGNVIHSTIIGR